MHNLKFTLAVIIFAAFPASVFADITLDWQSPGNNPVGYYYVSPYTAMNEATGQTLTLYCIDFNHEVAPPNDWQANIVQFDYADVPNYQYGNAGWSQTDTWTKYKTAAWLITQLSSITPVGGAGKHLQAVYQYAAWAVFLDANHINAYNASVGAAGGAAFAQEISNAYGSAVSAVAGGYQPAGWDIVVPNPRGLPGSTQEFLTPSAAIPEPSSIILLASVLFGVALFCRKRVTG